MGQVITENRYPVVSISVVDPDGETNSGIILYRGIPGSGVFNTLINSNVGSLTLNYTPNIPDGSTFYYYARILQSDGDLIYTSPIWYTRNDQVSIPELNNTVLDIKATPNPTHGKFILSFHTQTEQDFNLEIYSATGKLIMHQQLKNTSGNFAKQILLPSAASGIYLLRLTGSGFSRLLKVVVE